MSKKCSIWPKPKEGGRARKSQKERLIDTKTKPEKNEIIHSDWLFIELVNLRLRHEWVSERDSWSNPLKSTRSPTFFAGKKLLYWSMLIFLYCAALEFEWNCHLDAACCALTLGFYRTSHALSLCVFDCKLSSNHFKESIHFLFNK